MLDRSLNAPLITFLLAKFPLKLIHILSSGLLRLRPAPMLLLERGESPARAPPAHQRLRTHHAAPHAHVAASSYCTAPPRLDYYGGVVELLVALSVEGEIFLL